MVENIDIPILEIDPQTELRQVEKIVELKSKRDNQYVDKCLENIRTPDEVTVITIAAYKYLNLYVKFAPIKPAAPKIRIDDIINYSRSLLV